MLPYEKILGVRVDRVDRKQTLEIIAGKIAGGRPGKLLHLVTAYSEFFVTATKDEDFRKVLATADLVVADGVGPLAAIDYFSGIKSGDGAATKLLRGLVTGLKVIRGKVGQPVSGVWLFTALLEMAAEKKWRVFLLGGFGDTAEKLAGKLESKWPQLLIGFDRGEQDLDILNEDSDSVLEKINHFRPDILLVAYGPVKQEKWIARNKFRLAARVAIGVGGTFNEMLGRQRPAPAVVEKAGFKWLWRLIFEPRRLRRILNAFPIFPLSVFREALRR